MAKTGRERLMELGLAQREAEDVAADSEAKSSLPSGGEFAATRIGRPSEAGDIDSGTTPLVDFGEYFLNQIGISSPRQVRASIQQSKSVNEANNAMLQSAREKVMIVGQQVGGNDVDRMRSIVSALDEAASHMDSHVPEIQMYGREKLQNAVNELDLLQDEHAVFLGKQRDRFQGQIDNILDAGRLEVNESAGVIGLINELGDRNGMTAQLPVSMKQAYADYIGGSTFAQKVGADGLVPSIAIPFDPSEQITVGDALATIQAVKKNRRLALADQLGDINSTMINAGFKVLDNDGKFTVDEIDSPPLAEEIARLRHITPVGQPLNMKPGLPTAGDTQRTVENLIERGKGAVAGVENAFGRPAFGREVDMLKGFFGSIVDRAKEAANKPVVRESNAGDSQ